MDRRIEQKKGWRLAFSRKAMPYWGGALLLAFILWLIFRDNSSTLRIDGDTITTGDVTAGEFNDYIRISGQVQPMTTIQISPLEGGVVEEIIAEEGSHVRKGDEILRLSNENLDLQILNSEAELAEKENLLRNTMISMEQQKLSVKQERLQLQMEVRRYRRAYEQQKALYEEKLIARETWMQAEEDYLLAMDKLELVKDRELQDSLYRSVEIEQMQESLDNMKVNMQMIRKRKDNLTIKAPIDGELGLLDAVLGQSIASGAKIGQINDLSSYKIEARIDEHYIQGREIQGGFQVRRAAAGQHPHRADLLHEPAARPAGRSHPDPERDILSAHRWQMDICADPGRHGSGQETDTDRPPESPVLRSGRGPSAWGKGNNIQLRELQGQ